VDKKVIHAEVGTRPAKNWVRIALNWVRFHAEVGTPCAETGSQNVLQAAWMLGFDPLLASVFPVFLFINDL